MGPRTSAGERPSVVRPPSGTGSLCASVEARPIAPLPMLRHRVRFRSVVPDTQPRPSRFDTRRASPGVWGTLFRFGSWYRENPFESAQLEMTRTHCKSEGNRPFPWDQEQDRSGAPTAVSVLVNSCHTWSRTRPPPSDPSLDESRHLESSGGGDSYSFHVRVLIREAKFGFANSTFLSVGAVRLLPARHASI